MVQKKCPIRLQRDEDQLLRTLYTQWRLGRAQYKKRPDYLAEFTRVWNALSGRDDDPIDVYHYIETQQKITKRLEVPWPTFKGAHKRLPPLKDVFGPEGTLALISLYQQHVQPLEIGTDSLMFHPEVTEMLSKEFFKATGIDVPGAMLVAKLEQERKSGHTPTLRDSGLGFNDIDEVA